MPIRTRSGRKGYEVDVCVNNQRFKRVVRTRKEAVELEAHVKKEMMEAYHSKRVGRPPKKTFGQAMVRWIQEGAPKSMYSHARCIRPYMEEVLLPESITAAYEMKADFIVRGLSVVTINRRLAVVRRILNLAYDQWEWLDRPLGQRIKLDNERDSHRHYYLTRDEVGMLAGACKSTEVGCMIILAAYSGMRRGELFGLKKQSFKDSRIILDNKTKSKRPRSIPIPKHVHFICKRLPLKVTPDMLRNHFNAAKKLVGLDHIRFHDLRHTYCSWLVQNGVGLPVIKELAGHTTITTTMRYAHLGKNMIDIDSVLEKNVENMSPR